MLILFIKIILQILAVGLAVLVSSLDYVWHDKRTREFKKGRKYLFALSFVFLIFSIGLTCLDEYNSSQKEADLKARLDKVQQQNDGLQDGIAVLSGKSSAMLTEQRNSFVSVLEDQKKSGATTVENIKSATELLNSGIKNSIAKQEDLDRQQKTTFNSLTGGNSYCYILPTLLDDNTLLLVAFNPGEYPLFDVSIDMLDERFNEVFNQNLQGKLLFDRVQSIQKHYNVGTVGKTAIPVDRINLEGIEKKSFYLTFYTRFSTFKQDIQIIRKNNEWISAYQIFNVSAQHQKGKQRRTLIEQSIHPNFPTGKNGKVEWH